MTRKLLVTAFSVIAFSAPALAATEWYVVKNESTKKCEVTEAKPDGTSMMDIGKKVFATKADAEAAMTAAADCK
jgi:hypothetical protein